MLNGSESGFDTSAKPERGPLSRFRDPFGERFMPGPEFATSIILGEAVESWERR